MLNNHLKMVADLQKVYNYTNICVSVFYLAHSHFLFPHVERAR